MSVLLYAEHSGNNFKNAVLQTASLASALADKLGTDLAAVTVGEISDEAAASLGKYGVSTVYTVNNAALNHFADVAYKDAIAAAAEAAGASVVVMAQTYNGKAIAPRLSIKMDAAYFSGITSLPETGNGFTAQRLANSGKGIETISTTQSKLVISLKGNSYKVVENAKDANVQALGFSPTDMGAVTKEVVKASSKISITEADAVISGGRGFKGPENWGILEELAEVLNAGTACSKPVADMDWRPHHEHVGQTGIQIGPNLYIAIGISGAIQHLAGVNSSKNIVVINKDPEAPFFKIADYGIVGDLFEVVPKLTAAIKQLKAAAV